MRTELNNLISEIETGLLNGHISTNTPEYALEYHTKLGAYLSMCYGAVEKIDTAEAQHFVNNRDKFKSDLACKKEWTTSEDGIAQTFWLNRIKRIRVLIETLATLYYQGRDEKKYNELK